MAKGIVYKKKAWRSDLSRFQQADGDLTGISVSVEWI